MSLTRNSRFGLHTLALAALALPAIALGQLTGTSNPEDTPIGTAQDNSSVPPGYVATPKPSAGTAYVQTQNLQRHNLAPVQDGLPPAASTSSSFKLVGPTTDVVQSGSGALADGNDPDAGIVTQVDAPPNGFAAGTVLKVRMLDALSTQKTVVGSQWTAELVQNMERDGRVLIPAGSILTGRVTDTHSGRRITGEASMHLEPISIALPDGSRLGVHAQVIDTELGHGIKVDQEGTLLRRDHKAEEAGVLGLTAGSGAVAGALVAGPPGALVGAGVGAGVSSIIWLKQDRQAELPKGTELSLELNRPLIVGLR